MIQHDPRNPKEYTKREWMTMPRDYRFFLQVDMRKVVEQDAIHALVDAVSILPGVQTVKIYPGTNDPEQDLDNVIKATGNG